MENLKDIYLNPTVFRELAQDLKTIYPALVQKQFEQDLLEGLDQLEFKERIRRITEVCRAHLPENYLEALQVLYAFNDNLENRFVYIFMPDFVAQYGKEHYEASLDALRDFTPSSSSEDAIRPFIVQDQDNTLKAMLEWAHSDNLHIRRLASEGSRPRLPWSMQLKNIVKDPKLTWPILDALKADSSKYVQKSVANHINDISKDHPDWILDQLKNWDMGNPTTRWIIKHGCRTVIKAGHPKALALFGFTENPEIEIQQFQLSQNTVEMGSPLSFSFDLHSAAHHTQKLVIDYKLHFMKKSGKTQPKVFKLKELHLPAQQSMPLQNKYTFRDLTTRKHYPGMHAVELFINGNSYGQLEFEVTP